MSEAEKKTEATKENRQYRVSRRAPNILTTVTVFLTALPIIRIFLPYPYGYPFYRLAVGGEGFVYGIVVGLLWEIIREERRAHTLKE